MTNYKCYIQKKIIKNIKMNSPKKEIKNDFYEGENVEWEIENNFTISNSEKFESSEDFFENFSLEDGFNLEKKFDEFIGDSEESTELSLIVSNLNSTTLSNLNSDNTNQENDSENIELLNIMNRNQNITKNIFPCRKTFERSENSVPAAFSGSVKKISMTGRVLKSPIAVIADDDSKNDTSLKKPKVVKRYNAMKIIPERSSNPINSNSNLNDAAESNFTRKFLMERL